MKLNKIDKFAETRDATIFAAAIETRMEGAKAFEAVAPVQSFPSCQATAAAA